MRTSDRDERPRAEPRRQHGGRWKHHGARRLRNESRQENRERDRGGKGGANLRPRDVARLLADWMEEGDGVE